MLDGNANEVTQDNLKYLKNVFEYRNRTIAIQFVTNVDELKSNWEEGQFELSAKYQSLAVSSRIWDYYLAICCDFDEASLDNTTRFGIENDRFCCRKVFVFNKNPKNFILSDILEDLFPTIQSPTKIQLLEPSVFIPTLNTSPLITRDFFTKQMDDTELTELLDSLIVEEVESE